MKIEKHPFQPYIPPHAKVLFLGTFPPQQKRWSMNFYYPNWTNDFWRIMGLLFFDDKDYFCIRQEKTFDLVKIKDFLDSRGIALSDTAKEVIRLKDNASDKFLEIVTPLDLDFFFNECPGLVMVVTTGEKAASVISSITESALPSMGECFNVIYKGREFKHFRMPSTSRAYPLALNQKAEYYEKVFKNL